MIPATPFYRGRFAPSPTGPLHFGSLVAAVGSYLEARANRGEWRLRIEDVDTPRCSGESAAAILRTLEVFGFEWDGEVVWQSQRHAAYKGALDQLKAAGAVFPCACSRKEMADSATVSQIQRLAPAPDGATLYPGTCRAGLPAGKSARAWRLAVGAAQIEFDDAIQGPVRSFLAHEAGDFVVFRADGLFAYQLAVVVDDAEAGITHVVRGADLLDSTARQIYLQQRLLLPTPIYAHLPVAVNAAGEKLSKQTHARPVNETRPGKTLVAALDFMGQGPPTDLAKASVSDIWAWAKAHWRLAAVPCSRDYVHSVETEQDLQMETNR